jgi:hypothetical protein
MFNQVKSALKKYQFEIDANAIDFTDFNGIINDYEVEGSIEIHDNTLDYSVSFYDIKNDIEYDGMIGSFHGVDNDTNFDELIKRIILPNFVKLP